MVTEENWIWPTPSYGLRLPAEISTDYDGSVASFWIPGSTLLLQTSSYLLGGDSRSAKQRLADRVAVDRIEELAVDDLHPASAPEYAAAKWLDTAGTAWVYAYAVYAYVTIFASVSWDAEEYVGDGNWARRAVESISIAESLSRREAGKG